LAEDCDDHTSEVAEPRKINAGRSWDGSSNPRYRRNIPSPPNKADIAEKAHRTGAEFDIAGPLLHVTDTLICQRRLGLSIKFKVNRPKFVGLA
jgi:hypothetical protein